MINELCFQEFFELNSFDFLFIMDTYCSVDYFA